MKNSSTEPRPGESSQADSGALAASLLQFLSSERARFERFLDVTGLSPAGLRAAAADESFLLALLDYLAADEPLLLAYAAETGRDPVRVMALRDRLSRHPDEP